MIKKIECYVAVCDVCDRLLDADAEMVAHHDTEKESLEYAVERDDYGGGDGQIIDGKLCCTNCWTFDDDGEAVVRGGK